MFCVLNARCVLNRLTLAHPTADRTATLAPPLPIALQLPHCLFLFLFNTLHILRQADSAGGKQTGQALCPGSGPKKLKEYGMLVQRAA